MGSQDKEVLVLLECPDLRRTAIAQVVCHDMFCRAPGGSLHRSPRGLVKNSCAMSVVGTNSGTAVSSTQSFTSVQAQRVISRLQNIGDGNFSLVARPHLHTVEVTLRALVSRASKARLVRSVQVGARATYGHGRCAYRRVPARRSNVRLLARALCTGRPPCRAAVDTRAAIVPRTASATRALVDATRPISTNTST